MLSSVHFILALACLLGSAHALDMSMHLVSKATTESLHAELMARSTPGSSRFRQHMSMAELKRHTEASELCVDTAMRWLKAHGAADIRIGSMGDHVFFTMAETHVFGAPSAPAPRFGRQSLPVPQALVECVRFVFRATSDKPQIPKRSTLLRGSFPGMNQDPTTIAARYNVSHDPIPTVANFSQGVAEFEGEQFYQSNIDAFNTRYGFANNTIEVSGPNKGGYFGEGNLDLEYIQSIAACATTWWIAEKDFDFTKWTENVLTIKPMPLVLSISWGSGESGFDNVTMESESEEFRKLGLLGATIFAASGDQGTGTTGFLSCGTFDPTWPATSPYVTAVGGTYADTQTSDEISWSGSGGGFSTVFAAPPYQLNAISTYTSTTILPPPQYFTAGGRGIPDVAALSNNFEVYSYGWGTETGTSAATPTFAAVVTRINAQRLSEHKAPLGFINPTLYAAGHVGFDVISGNNQVSGCPAGFNATVGWDAISGLGTPIYGVLESVLSGSS
jgi:tripeptidyl-peptidase I